MDKFQRPAFGRFAHAHGIGQILRLLIDRNLGQIGESGIVGGGVDDHRIAGWLDALFVEECRQGLQGRDQRVECCIPIGRAFDLDHRFRRQRNLLAKGVGGADRRGSRWRGRGSSRGRRSGRGGWRWRGRSCRRRNCRTGGGGGGGGGG